MQRKVTLFAFPLHLKIPNGYWDQLYDGIAKARSEIVLKHNDFLGLVWAWHSINVVHIHWPSILYASRWRFVSLFKLALRVGIVILAKMRGDRIVWTMHNIRDHEGKNVWLDVCAHWFLLRLSDAIIVHTPAGADLLKKEYKRVENVHCIPHPNYIGFHGPRFPLPDPALAAEHRLKLNDKVFLSFGSIRPYKNLELIINVFNRLPDDYTLIVAGKSFYPSYLAALRARTRKNNVRFVPRTISNEDTPRYFSLARASLFAFREVLTSGSVILSQSYGVPVIAPRRGDMPYVIKEGVNGYLYQDEEVLKARVERFAHMDEVTLKKFQESTLRDAESIPLESIVHATLEVYGI
ncbi:MAG: glycosyltransferase family 4 protein [Patescibacteria group bacterium]